MTDWLRVILFWPVTISLGFAAVSLVVAVSGWLERRSREERRP